MSTSLVELLTISNLLTLRLLLLLLALVAVVVVIRMLHQADTVSCFPAYT